MNNISRFYLLILLTILPLHGQDYLWPVKVKKSISSNFGEFRPRRFHAGLDIRTNGSAGHEVVAVDDGYIWRVKVSFDGYGKAIYLRLNDGNIALYAHLNRFIPVLNDIIKLEQNRQKSYSVEKYFGETEFTIKKGDLLGYSGESGSAYAPHLHFEIRDPNNRPLNPLTNGLVINDHRLPIPESIAIIPLSRDASINGSSLPQIFPLRRIKKDVYEFPDTIQVFGTVGLEVSATDKISGIPNKFNIYGITLSVDGKEEYRIEFNSFPFEQSKLIEIQRDFSFQRLNDGEFHRLFATGLSKQLDLVDNKSRGQLKLSPGYHRVNIKLYDHAKNLIRITGTLLSSPPIEIEASITQTTEETIRITISPHKSPFPITDIICYSFNENGFVEQKIEAISKQQDERNLIVEIPELEAYRKILQFIGINKLGAVSYPFHLPIHVQSSDHMTVGIEFSASHLENSVILQVETSSYITQNPDIILVGDDKYFTLKSRRVRPNTFLSEPLDPVELAGVKDVIVYISGSPVRETRFTFKPKVGEPFKTLAAISPDGNCSLQALTSTFYDTTVFWIENVEKPVPVEGGSFMSDTYQLQPFDRPLQDSARVAISLSEAIRDPSKIGIFYYDQENGWTYLLSRFSKKKWVFFSSLYYLEAVALVEDTVKPVISNIFPGSGGRYNYQDVKTISAHVEDKLAGIKGDTALLMVLDGQNLIFEYHPIKKTMTYTLDTPLDSGEHKLIIGATDQVGNYATQEIIFNIN